MESSSRSIFNSLGDKKGFVSPFLMDSNTYYPTDHIGAMDFCAFLYHLNGIYKEASNRVISHFITDIEFEGKVGSKDEQDALKSFLFDDLDCIQTMLNTGNDWAAYGFGVTYLHIPFVRFLRDTRNPTRPKYYNLNSIPEKYITFELSTMTYKVKDPSEIAKGVSFEDASFANFDFIDKFDRNPDRIRLVQLDPRFCRFKYGTMSTNKQLLYDFDPEFRTQVKAGDLYEVNNTPKAMLEAIKEDAAYRFNDNSYFVFTGPGLTGIAKKGFGVPNVIANYREIHQLQVYRRADESIARDYMIPMRVLSPGFAQQSGSVMDSAYMMNVEKWKKYMEKVIKTHRTEQDSIFAVPMPTQYQQLGGEGKNFSTKDLVELQMNTVLDSVGYPAELFKGTMAFQQVPIALRIFEQRFHFIYKNFNKLLNWVNAQTSRFLKKEEIGIRLVPSRIADDIENRQLLMSLMAGGEVPRQGIFESLGMKDPTQAYKRRLQEDTEFAIAGAEEEKKKEKMLANAQQELANPGSTSDGGGGGGGASPLDQTQKAAQLAQQWLQMPEGERKKNMDQTQSSDPTLYALAKQLMSEQRSSWESQGRQQGAQQAQQPPGAQGDPGQPPPQ